MQLGEITPTVGAQARGWRLTTSRRAALANCPCFKCEDPSVGSYLVGTTRDPFIVRLCGHCRVKADDDGSLVKCPIHCAVCGREAGIDEIWKMGPSVFVHRIGDCPRAFDRMLGLESEA